MYYFISFILFSPCNLYSIFFTFNSSTYRSFALSVLTFLWLDFNLTLFATLLAFIFFISFQKQIRLHFFHLFFCFIRFLSKFLYNVASFFNKFIIIFSLSLFVSFLFACMTFDVFPFDGFLFILEKSIVAIVLFFSY